MASPFNSSVRSVKVEKVIIVESSWGMGTKEDSCRIITEIFSADGELLARRDPVDEFVEVTK